MFAAGRRGSRSRTRRCWPALTAR